MPSAVYYRDMKKAKPKKTGPDVPPLSLLVKIGSIAVHADEFFSPGGHEFDKTALQQLLHDPEVVAWIKQMGPLLPRKRNRITQT